MRKLILVLLAFAGFTFAGLASAQAETTWTSWGVAPYASSQDEAVGLLPDALRALNIPEPVRVLFQEEVRRNPQGVRVYLNPGDRFVAMMSRGGRVLNDVVVGRNPVSRGVVQAAEAREWRVEHAGQTYVLVLPDICNNWAWRVEQTARATETPDCVEIRVDDTRPGDRMTVRILSGDTPRPRSACWGYKEGSGDWQQWPECPRCFNIRAPGVVFSIPREVAERYVIEFCVERDGRPSRIIGARPTTWSGRSSVQLPQWRWE